MKISRRKKFRVIVFWYSANNDNSELGILLLRNSENSKNSKLSSWPNVYYLSVLLNFFVDEDEDENKLFSDDNEEITSPDLDEPNFNEMKELKSSI